MFKPIVLLVLSNLFMTFAWYGHLKNMNTRPLLLVIVVSWGIAFFEYILQVPANRIGIRYFNLGQGYQEEDIQISQSRVKGRGPFGPPIHCGQPHVVTL